MNPGWQLSIYKNILLLQLGDLLSEHTNKEVLQMVDARYREGFTDCIVDLGRVHYINSVGLNLLIILMDRAKKGGGRLILAEPTPKVVQLLKMTKLYPLFEQADTLEEALAICEAQKN